LAHIFNFINESYKGILYLLATNEQSKTDKTGGGYGGGQFINRNKYVLKTQ